MRQPLEGAWNLPDALRRIVRRVPLNRIVIDDRPQHDRIVGIQPERDLFLSRHPGDRCRGDEVEEAVELAALGLEGPVIDVAVADVEIEQLIERLSTRSVGERLLGRRNGRKQRKERKGNEHGPYRTQSRPLFADYTRWARKRARAV